MNRLPALLPKYLRSSVLSTRWTHPFWFRPPSANCVQLTISQLPLRAAHIDLEYEHNKICPTSRDDVTVSDQQSHGGLDRIVQVETKWRSITSC